MFGVIGLGHRPRFITLMSKQADYVPFCGQKIQLRLTLNIYIFVSVTAILKFISHICLVSLHEVSDQVSKLLTCNLDRHFNTEFVVSKQRTSRLLHIPMNNNPNKTALNVKDNCRQVVYGFLIITSKFVCHAKVMLPVFRQS